MFLTSLLEAYDSNNVDDDILPFPTIFFMYIYKSEINLNKLFIQIYLVVFFLLPITYATDSF